MIANPRKFKAIVLSKNNIDTVDTKFQIREKAIYSSDKVDLLGIANDDQLNFESYISEICRKAAGQLNALYCLTKISTRAKRSISRVFSLFIVPAPFLYIARTKAVLTGPKAY